MKYEVFENYWEPAEVGFTSYGMEPLGEFVCFNINDIDDEKILDAIEDLGLIHQSERHGFDGESDFVVSGGYLVITIQSKHIQVKYFELRLVTARL